MASTTKQTIEEIDYVAFTEAIDKDEGTGKWPAGTRGTVVIDLGDHKMVEISDADNYGATLDMPVVPVEKLKLVTKYSKGIEARPPDITNVVVPAHGRLRLTFADGLSGDVDVLERMHGPVFARARTPKGFAEARVDPETGTVCWPNGADLAPDTLYERIRTGLWPGQSHTA